MFLVFLLLTLCIFDSSNNGLSLIPCRLSGLSPFAGDNDVETLKNVRACDWEFDDDAFANISNEGKDFISKLLTRSKE